MLRILRKQEAVPFELDQLAFELYTIVPIRRGFAAIGLADLYNFGANTIGLRCTKSHAERRTSPIFGTWA